MTTILSTTFYAYFKLPLKCRLGECCDVTPVTIFSTFTTNQLRNTFFLIIRITNLLYTFSLRINLKKFTYFNRYISIPYLWNHPILLRKKLWFHKGTMPKKTSVIIYIGFLNIFFRFKPSYHTKVITYHTYVIL